ncbi:hypothetical protein KR084_009669 [Drosophila pseudotakahashii]|nr:hypothetical protein KR084_009669 [Drosophila pseudotakahashii]
MGNEALVEGSGSTTSGLVKPLEFGVRFSDETVEEEDEWCDFTEENRMQYTSLRRSIQMSLSSTILTQFSVGGEVKVQDSEQRDTGGDGIDVGQANGDGLSSCPWQKIESQLQLAPMMDKQTEKELPEKEEPSEVKSQIYIPPALRQSQGDFNQRPQVENRQRKTHSKMSGKHQAPDLNSPEYFPTLSGSKPFKRTK